MPEDNEVKKGDTNNNQNSDVSLFDLTKSEGEHKISHEIPIQKASAGEQRKPESLQEERKTYQKPEQIEEELPTTRQEAQLGQTTISPISADIKPESEQAQEEKESTTQKKPIRNIFWLIAKFILFIVGSFLFVYLFLNFPALWKKLTYYFQEKTGEKPQIQTIIPPDINEDLLFLSTVTLYDAPSKGKDEEKPKEPSKNDLGLSGLENNQLIIPKIDVAAPIVWDSPVDEATMMENLKYGVVQYSGTTKPGEKSQDGEGNVFISGHSSYYWWDDGKYKTIFANLDQIEVGDEIGVGYDDYGYVYRVYEKTIVSPDDINVLSQDTDKHILSLMTCYPVGTNSKRLIVKAEYVARGTDQPQVIEEESIEESPVSKPDTPLKPTPIETTVPSQIPSSQPKNVDVLDLLPWNW